MDDRERDILATLIESDKPFYVAADMSDVYALAPDNMDPGMMRFSGELTGMTEDQIENYVIDCLDSNDWTYIPYRTFTEVRE